MEYVENFIEEQVNNGVEERNSSYLNFVDSWSNPETEDFHRHISNLGDHHISDPPNNENFHDIFHIPNTEYTINSSHSVVESETEEENELDKYKEDKNNESNQHLKENLPDYFYFIDHNK